MKIIPTLGITLVLLHLLVNNIESRYEPGGHWRKVMEEDCLEDMKFENVKDIEPRPSFMSYPDDIKDQHFAKDIEPRPSLTFYPNNNVKAKLFIKDIEPRPTGSFYPNDVNVKFFIEDIEPRPSFTSYPNDDIKDELLTKDIEPRTSATFNTRDMDRKVSSTDDRHGDADIQMITEG